MSDHIQMLEDIGAQFDRVAREAETAAGAPRHRTARKARRARIPARAAAAALCLTVLLAGTAYAVPATRTAVGGVVDELSGWVLGNDDDSPGRLVGPTDNAPSWFTERPGEARVIAEAEGVGLFVRRTESDGVPTLQFALGPGMAVGGTLDSWKQRLGEHSVVVLPGPAVFGPRDFLDNQGRFPLVGVTTRDIARVELQYESGPPLTAENGDGGFVLLADAWRPLRTLVAYDAAGQVRERTDVSTFDMSRFCKSEPGCPTDVAGTRGP